MSLLTSNTDLLLCHICKKNQFKYTCPGCSIKTCSLPCCRLHKQGTGCTGQRDKTKYLKKEEFTELDLLSDYKFLEESSNLIDAAQRQAAILDTNPGPNSTNYTGFFDNLRKFVKAQFGITLNLMPIHATRHQANKTRFNRSSKIVSWSLELIFHSSAANLIKLNTKKNLFSSKDTLRGTLTKFYEKYKNELFDVSVQRSNEASNIALYTEFNKEFESGNFDDLNVLFQVVDFEKKFKYYVKLDLDSRLEDALMNRMILEYPTLYIVRNSKMSEYRMASQEKSTESKEEEKKRLADLEEGECDSVESDEVQSSDEELNEVVVSKRELDISSEVPCESKAVGKKLKADDDSEEDGELDDSN